jgi:GNAT superfamily N-acetyltransferase
LSANLTVRPVVPADFPKWAPLWEGYNRFYKRVIPAEVTQMTWVRFFDAYEPMRSMVAEQDGKLVGMVNYLFHRNTAMIAPVCYLQDLYTDETIRGKGIGRALIEAVYAAAKAAGSPRVYWMTHETNLTAMKLYDKVAERSGFVQYRKQI